MSEKSVLIFAGKGLDLAIFKALSLFFPTIYNILWRLPLHKKSKANFEPLLYHRDFAFKWHFLSGW